MKSLFPVVFFITLAAGVPSMPIVASAAALQNADATEVAAKVKSQIAADAELQGYDVTVTARGSAVTLNGEVPSALVRAKIGEVAKSTEGVTKVDNKLKLAKGK